MPKRPVKYLVHDTCDLNQQIKIGQKQLISCLKNEYGIKVDKNQLSAILAPAKTIDDMSPEFYSTSSHKIVIEELFDGE
jgi:hypothetical protein